MQNLTGAEQKLVNFNGAEIMAVKCYDDKIYAGVKWICNGMRLDKSKSDVQVQKIQNDMVLSMGACKINHPSISGNQDTLFIELDFLPLWLAKINASIIKDPVVQRNIIEFQLKAKDVLSRAFLNKPSLTIPQNMSEALCLIENLFEENQGLLPKAAAYDEFLSADNASTIGTAAQFFGTGELRFFKFLRDQKILKKNGTTPYQKYLDRGYFNFSEMVKELSPDDLQSYLTAINPSTSTILRNKLIKRVVENLLIVIKEQAKKQSEL